MEFSQLLGIGIAYILLYCYSDSKRTSCQSNMDKNTFALSISLILLFSFVLLSHAISTPCQLHLTDC
jgi:hypothetical protein